MEGLPEGKCDVEILLQCLAHVSAYRECMNLPAITARELHRSNLHGSPTRLMSVVD
jgi:hypothetical protein